MGWLGSSATAAGMPVDGLTCDEAAAIDAGGLAPASSKSTPPAGSCTDGWGGGGGQWWHPSLGSQPLFTLDTPLVDFSCLPINRVSRSSVKLNGDEHGGSLLACPCFIVVGLKNTIVVGLFPSTAKPPFGNGLMAMNMPG